MNKRTIDNEVYERYVDATVALFMECYSVVSLPKQIRAEFDKEGNVCDEFTFPTELDNRCRRLIRKELSRNRRKQYLYNVVKGFKYAAACFVVLLSLASFLFMTVEAIRIPIINYYISQHDGHWEISSQTNTGSHLAETNSTDETNNKTIDLKNPLAELIPQEYQLLLCEGEVITDMVAIYENSNSERICFSAVPGEHWIAIDSENAQISHQHEICGYDAITVVKDGAVSLTWIHKELTTVFTLMADNMSDSEIVAIAEQLIRNIN